MINIISPTLRVQRFNRELAAGGLIVVCLAVTLLSSVVVSMLTVKVTSVTATEDFHYVVKVNNLEFDLVPGDVLRIERTPAKKALTGQEIEILKVFTTKGFIYATPDDSFYDGTRKLAGAADWESRLTWMKQPSETTLKEVRKKSYSIGTPTDNQVVLFVFLGMQNLALLIAGFTLVFLIFPLRRDKEGEGAPVVTRVEQPA